MKNKDLGICIPVCGRPNYLFIVLQSLFRCEYINEIDVCLYINKKYDEKSIICNASEFPISRIFLHKNFVGCYENHRFAFEDMFHMGYEKVLQIEADVIVRKDILDTVLNIKEKAFVYLLSRGSSPASLGDNEFKRCFNAQCPMFEKDSFNILNCWLKSNIFWDLKEEKENPLTFREMVKQENRPLFAWDGVIQKYMILNNAMGLTTPISYAFHIGLRNSYGDIKDEFIRMEAEFFNGDKKNWLDNVVKLHNEIKKQQDSLFNKMLIPFDFEFV